MNRKFDFKDITLVPEVLSSISSRTSCSILNDKGTLPIMVSPMDTVVSEENYELFINQGFDVCLPRCEYSDSKNIFISISLDEFEEYITYFDDFEVYKSPKRILVDIANGHMKKLYDLSKTFLSKTKGTNYELMVGNIANPKTYQKFAEIGVHYIRVGIGGGSGCLTSANTGIHYPMASLINECFVIKKQNGYQTKIVADGGFRNYDDIIKALALGADYVMLGGVLNKTLESSSETELFKLFPISENTSIYLWNEFPFLRKHFYKKFRGMSTKEVQKKWGKSKLTTSEGITKYNKVEYTLSSWTENLKDYLRSAMSYTNSTTLEEFKESEHVFISQNALNRFHK
jgi:IMP dehydrogenase/GMP reductase